MYRNSPARNPRSKGLKIKHVLQLCLLVAVCFWLIFQVKRSHDKRKEIDGNDSKISRTTNSEEILKLGRKDLKPNLDESMKETEKKHEEHEEHKEHEEEEEEKMEEEKDDGRGGGDDEIDENEQEKIAQEEEDMKDEDDHEREEKDGQSQTENEVYVEDRDQDGASKVTREAREEHYKADDASSAVTHGSHNAENGTLDNSTENLQANINGTQNSPMEVKVKVKDGETRVNVTVSGDSIHTDETQNAKETGKSLNSPKISDSNVSIAEENISGSSETEGDSDAIQGENTDTNNVIEETDESLDSSETDNPDEIEIEHDVNDSIESLHLEEKEIRNDLDTLPEIETEGGNEEDSAAE